MSALSQQLQQIKNQQRSLIVAPSQQQPTLIFDTHTATNTSHDLIYTLAIISYSKLLSAQPSLRQEGQTIMADHNRQINRNTLTKEANRQLSESLIKLLVKLGPFLLTEDGQKIMEYLLHNYKVNTFQAEALAIIYLQYWNSPVYVKLITNIPQKILNNKLSFLNKLKTQSVNISFIVKHLLYSHYLISSLILYTLQYMRTQNNDNLTMDIQISLGEQLNHEDVQNISRCDPRRFLLQVFSELVTHQHTASYKYVIEFCAKAAQLKHHSAQTISMIMLLSTRLFIADSISDQLLTNLHLKLLKKLSLYNDKTSNSLFDFTMIIWQRKPSCIKKESLYYLQDHQKFIKYLSKFKCSLSMVLIRFIQLYIEGSSCQKLISCLGARIKKDQFYEMYSDQYHKRLFELVEKAYMLEDGEKTNFIGFFIKENFLYEAALYYHEKEISNDHFKNFIITLFPKNSYQRHERGTVLFNTKLIKRKMPSAPKPQKEQQSLINEENDSQGENKGQQKQKHSLLTKLRKFGFEVNHIDFSNKEIKQALVQILDSCYCKKQELQVKDKLLILDNYPEQYNQQYLRTDLASGHFILPIKYLTAHQSVPISKICAFSLISNISLIDNVLFRQLFRISLQQIAATLNTQYKSIIYFANTLSKQLISNYLNQQGENVQLLKLSEVLLKVSEALFLKDGIKRGKYHRILHNHGKVIAELLMRVKQTKKISTRHGDQQAAVLEQYIRIVNVFKPQNVYLLNIGIIQIITRKQLDHSLLRYFIKAIIYGSLNQGGVTHWTLAVSIIKTLVFCSQLATVSIPQDSIDPSFSSGIAKGIIADYFGLVKQKFKRVITKKLLLSIRTIFQDTYVVEHFKSHLVQLPKNELETILNVYTELYRILGVMGSEDKQIYNFREAIMDKITNIFPFDLRLPLFQPLLPDQHLYKYLGEQLAEHRPERSQFDQLASIANVVPTQLSSQWVLFMKECLKRGYFPSEDNVTAVLQSKQLGDISNYAQYICALAEYSPTLLHNHLDRSVEIIEAHCAQPSDFTLAIISKMIRNLGQLLEPYLEKLLQVALTINSEYIPQFIEDVTEHLVTPTLIKVIRGQAKHATNIPNFCLFFKSAATKGVGDSLNKTLLHLMSRTLSQLAESEENPQSIVKLQAQIFFQIGIKMNESQLRKMIIELVRWSQTKVQIEQSLPFNLRKISVAHIFSLLSENLQALFNPFFGYVFESFVKDYQAITATLLQNKQKLKTNSNKRTREANSEYQQSLIQSYLSISLHCFKLLFTQDTNHEFLDSFKIEALGDPLTELVLLYQLDNFTTCLNEHLIPSLIAFHQAIADDYQMKTINLKIMILLKNKNSKIHRAVFELTDQLIEALNDRFLLLVNDLIPFLLEYAGSRHEGISKVVRKIISRIEQLSGEQIQNYVK